METMTLGEEIVKVIKGVCHFSVEDGKCGTFDSCPDTKCFYAQESLTQIFTPFRRQIGRLVNPYRKYPFLGKELVIGENWQGYEKCRQDLLGLVEE